MGGRGQVGWGGVGGRGQVGGGGVVGGAGGKLEVDYTLQLECLE